MKVYLLTSGSGDWGDEWNLISIHSSPEKWEEARALFRQPRKRPDGSTYAWFVNDTEIWEVDSQ